MASLVTIALAATALLGCLATLERGERPLFLDRSSASEEKHDGGRPRRGEDKLQLAGSGSNVPLTRALIAAYVRQYPEKKVMLHESIGSSGGVQAVLDGAIDLGLISRDLTAQERQAALELVPYAWVAVVFASHPSVPVRDLSQQEVLAMYSGAQARWPDGTAVTVLQREAGDSAHLIAGRAIPGFLAVDELARTEQRWRMLFHDRAMQEALMGTPGAIGLSDLGGVKIQNLAIKILSFNGIEASQDQVLSGRYPLHKPLSFVCQKPVSAPIQHFIDFVQSSAGKRMIEDSGYIALDSGQEPSP